MPGGHHRLGGPGGVGTAGGGGGHSIPNFGSRLRRQLASGDPIPAVGRDIGFTTTMPFEDGHFIALSSPDTNSIQRLLYGSEVLTGTIGIGRAPAEEMAFTRATSRTGSLVGFTIDGGGDIVSLAIRAAPKGTGERPFDLLATGSGAVYRGSCH